MASVFETLLFSKKISGFLSVSRKRVTFLSHFLELRCKFSFSKKSKLALPFTYPGNKNLRRYSVFFKILDIVNFDHICAGTIVAENWVLTSTRCCDYYQPEDLMVVAGYHDLTIATDDAYFPVQEIFLDPLYNLTE